MAKPGGAIKKGWGELGGNGKMHGFNGVGTQTPDRSSQEGSGGRRDQKAKGGASGVGSSEGTSNKYHAGTQTPGQSAAHATNNDKFAKGGTTSMFGNRGSQRCEPGKSAC